MASVHDLHWLPVGLFSLGRYWFGHFCMFFVNPAGEKPLPWRRSDMSGLLVS